MSNLFENYKKSINIFRFGCKICCIILCGYYIKHYSEYKVSWNLATWLFPNSFLLNIDKFLSLTGTYILTIPIIIIICSWLMQNSQFFERLAVFLAVGSIVTVSIKFWLTGDLNEYVDMRLFTVYHEMTFEEKKLSFLNEYDSLIKNLGSISNTKLKFLKEHMDHNFFNKYYEIIKKLPANEIKEYASKVFVDVNTAYEAKFKSSIWGVVKDFCSQITLKNILVTVSGVGAIFLLHTFLASFGYTGALQAAYEALKSQLGSLRQIKHQLDTFVEQMTEQLGTVQKLIQAVTELIPKVGDHVFEQIMEKFPTWDWPISITQQINYLHDFVKFFFSQNEDFHRLFQEYLKNKK